MRFPSLFLLGTCLLGLILLAPGARTEEDDKPAQDKSVPASAKAAASPGGLKNLGADDWSNVVRGQLDTADDQLAQDDSYYDTWTHDGIAGEILTLELTSVDFDPYLMLFLPTEGGRRKLAQDDDSGLGRTARLQFKLPETATYEIYVNTARSTLR